MLKWKMAEDGICLVLCKRNVDIARICPATDHDGWEVSLGVHHPEDTGSFRARSKEQAMNVAEMWANREGERLDREVGLVINTGEWPKL